MRLVRLLGLLVLCTGCLPVPGAAAASLTVSTTADSGPGSLRAAILASNDPAVTDTIQISATGVIELVTALPPIRIACTEFRPVLREFAIPTRT